MKDAFGSVPTIANSKLSIILRRGRCADDEIELHGAKPAARARQRMLDITRATPRPVAFTAVM